VTPQYSYRVVRVFPHDPTAFTQGLEFHAGFLYESTGLEGRSVLRRVALDSGHPVQETRLAPNLFGEGITVLNGQITQITWQTHIGFVYDQSSFRVLRTFQYPGEGWGLTNDGRQIYMSDGSAQIRCWDAATLDEKRRLTVRDGDQEIRQLNELEYVRGEIYANVWGADRVVRISPADGRVLGWIDFAGLLTPEEQSRADVLNGIAFDVAGGRLFVTGKLWPKLFEVELVPKRNK